MTPIKRQVLADRAARISTRPWAAANYLRTEERLRVLRLDAPTAQEEEHRPVGPHLHVVVDLSERGPQLGRRDVVVQRDAEVLGDNQINPYDAPVARHRILGLRGDARYGVQDAAAHALGFVHRDVTPRNVLRLGDRWVVADWGVMRRPRGMTTLVRTQGFTDGFTAPELLRGDAHLAGESADVYS